MLSGACHGMFGGSGIGGVWGNSLPNVSHRNNFPNSPKTVW